MRDISRKSRDMSIPCMKIFWRISNYENLNGEGGRRGSARWHTKGRPVVYMAESAAGAMLERLVHLEDSEGMLPRTYTLLKIEAPETSAIHELMPLAEAGWRERPLYTQLLGDAWLTSGSTALARVPSAVVPYTWNYLLNPEHADAPHVSITETLYERFDPRLLNFGAR
jgi:RES domain-containing protein